MRLFVSHSVADKALVDAIIDLLEVGMGIASVDIFCSSFDEQGIPPGQDFGPYMRERLQKAEAVLAIVSPQYYESPFCFCETGGAWVSGKPFVPLLVEPVGYDDLRGALYGKQGLLMSVPEKLDALRDALSFLGESKTTRWNRKKEKFLEELPGLLKKMKPVALLKGLALKKLKDDLAAAQKEAADLDEQNEELSRELAELRLAKDAKAAEAIRRKYSSEDKQFEELLESARDAITELPAVAREAMRVYLRNEYFNPKAERWGDEVENAVQSDYLSESDNRVELNDDHPEVETAITAWHALTDFVDEVSEAFKKHYREEHKRPFNLTSVPFWEHHGLL